MKIRNNIQKQGLDALVSTLDKYGIAHSESYDQTIGNRRWDVKLYLPGLKKNILIETKAVFYPRQVEDFAHAFAFELASIRQQHGSDIPLVITRRITANAFDCCIRNNIGVLDLDGNISIQLPGLIIERYREEISKDKVGTSGTAFSARASRVARALLSRPKHQWEQAELVKETSITQGYVSQVLAKLRSDRYIHIAGGTIKLIEPDRLLDDWLSHYRFDRHLRKEYAISFSTYEDGLRKLSGEMKRLKVKFVFTGWSGAFLKAPYGIPVLIMAYVEKFPDLRDSSVLFPLQKGQNGNVLLLEPHDEGVFQFIEKQNDNPVVSAPQLYLDMSRMPGREKEQAEAIREKLLNYGDME